MLNYFSIKHILFSLWGYDMSHLEFWATITGGVAVWLSAKENIWSWVLGLINVVLAFGLFYQIQLYPDMFLQVFFFITNIIGFYLWKYPKIEMANTRNELKISALLVNQKLYLSILAIIGTLLLGTFSKNLNSIFPKLFSLPSAFPYTDSFTTVMSIAATFLLMKKKLEAWWIWLLVDIISAYMYYIKDIKLYAFLYLIFCIIAVFGALEWQKSYKKTN